ncbi:hypothetical protein Pmani_023048 [Petrolisthes manimaculis]|uniref:Proton-coupled folate transporter n=1 Tax=Petrolisthes manimaculis TaxID=1843537 RepID=A0AAE1U007_9EUCA|nr:hypothetical protein Pmani_023048 [Petrolisthes manimaculis]
MSPNPVEETTPLLKNGPSLPKHNNNDNNITTSTHHHINKAPEDVDSSSKSTSSPSSSSSRCGWLSLVTVEPALLLHGLSSAVESVFKINMTLDKVCSIQLQYSQEVCQNLDSGDYNIQQDKVQDLTNQYNLYSLIIEMGPAVFIMILLGTLSDTWGRRLPLMLPMLGCSIKALGLIMNAYWWSLQPFYILLSYIPFGLMGGFMAPFMAAYAYLSENSGSKWRTTRLSFAGALMMVTMSAGRSLGAIIYSHWGYIAVFTCEFLLSATSVVYVIIRFSNDQRPKSVARGSSSSSSSSTGDAENYSILKSVKHSVMVVLKKREDGVRAQIFGHIACIALFVSTFGWDVCIAADPQLLPGGRRDHWLYWGGVRELLLDHAWYGTRSLGTLSVTAVAVSLGGGMTITSSRGVLSKLVATDELGAVFAVVGLFESLLPLVSSSLFTLIYNNTLEFFPGTLFVVAGGISLFICCLYTWLAGYSRPVIPSKQLMA